MHRKASIIISTLLLLSQFVALEVSAKPRDLQPGIDFSGPHFNLNLHAIPEGEEKPVPSDSGSGRHSVFVPFDGDPSTNDFELHIAQQGVEWTVTDCDATDGDGEVSIILPDEIWEDTDGDGILGEPGEDTKIGDVKAYRVYVVGLGKPDESSSVVLMPDVDVTEPDPAQGPTQTIYYELTGGPLTIDGHRKGGKGKGNTGQPVWYNATDLFLATVWMWEQDVDHTLYGGDPVDGNWWIGADWQQTLEDCDGYGTELMEVVEYLDYWVFDIEELTDYWWEVQNNGVKLMKVRFYPILKGKGNGNGNG